MNFGETHIESSTNKGNNFFKFNIDFLWRYKFYGVSNSLTD